MGSCLLCSVPDHYVMSGQNTGTILGLVVSSERLGKKSGQFSRIAELGHWRANLLIANTIVNTGTGLERGDGSVLGGQILLNSSAVSSAAPDVAVTDQRRDPGDLT
ncbi:hypothetical protein DICSQDRAFT_139715, partial [Dichomitus squalens LYAD-421 SS1]